MNGVHDMGGMHGMGPVVLEKDEPVFHEAWERRAFALTLAAGYLGRWNLDMSRHARERMPPAEYLATSYYEHWLWGLEQLLRESGLLEPGTEGGLHPLRAADVLDVLRNAPGAGRDDVVAAGFRPGDRVRARMINPTGHTRLPRYARGRQGVVDRDHGVWIFPDTNAAGQGPRPQHVYSVRFAAQELWGPDASPRDAVFLDLWEDYLDAA